jgi:hypothetical protein
MHTFLKKRIGGFSLRINTAYGTVAEESFLNTLIDDACRHFLNKNKVKFVSTLPNGTSIYVKFWRPRRAIHRVKTIWHPTRIEAEGRQYFQFTEKKLPVPDIVLWGSQRIPLSKFGIFKAGMVVTKQIDGGENLRTLYMQKIEPWTIRNLERKFEVLERVAQLLYSIHEKNLVHGDYMLKNIVFTPEKPNGRYWIIDLGSGWSLPLNKSLSSSERNRELCRMVYSLARNGFSRNDALYFLKSYICCEKGNNHSYKLAHNLEKKYLDICLSQKDHRAIQATHLFASNRSS